MFGKILYISDNIAHVENISNGQMNSDLMNLHVIFESGTQRVLGEVVELNTNELKIRFLGEFLDGRYVNGVLRKPKLNSALRIINTAELTELIGTPSNHSMILGESAIYKGFKVCPELNSLFANHLAIFGNSGSGKSYGVSRIVQNVFNNQLLVSYNANLLFFDAYGEYKTAFRDINKLNPAYNYKFITTNKQDPDDFDLRIPISLLTLDDFALLLQANSHSQLPIISNAIKLAKIFSQNTDESEKYKNHLIAKALIAILFSNQTTTEKKNEIFRIIEICHTKEFDFGAIIPGVGYQRSLADCFEIDSNGNFGESVLITDYILKHVNEELERILEPEYAVYSLKDFRKALDFTLISEGFQSNKALSDDAMLLKVRLNSIINSKLENVFVADDLLTEDFISTLLSKNNRKAQIININLEDIDDTYAKVIVKIFARLIFQYAKGALNRAALPFHLFLEEAHRYIQSDNDTFLLGYNIFDRIAKEGRKYAVLLDIITQRPVEMSDTVVAQISNFLIFKMTHPKDLKYIEEMLPNISADVISKQKILQPGHCVCFGSAFKIPMIIHLEVPNPPPHSSSCDISNTWKSQRGIQSVVVDNISEPEVNDLPEESNNINNTSETKNDILV